MKARSNIRMETDVPKSHALCKEKSTMRAFSTRGSCGRYASNCAALPARLTGTSDASMADAL